jgi:hypothetical protein
VCKYPRDSVFVRRETCCERSCVFVSCNCHRSLQISLTSFYAVMASSIEFIKSILSALLVRSLISYLDNILISCV